MSEQQGAAVAQQVQAPERQQSETMRVRLEADADAAEWAKQWAYANREVQIWCLGDPPIRRPEKDWHVIVYGGGRAALDSLRRK